MHRASLYRTRTVRSCRSVQNKAICSPVGGVLMEYLGVKGGEVGGVTAGWAGKGGGGRKITCML